MKRYARTARWAYGGPNWLHAYHEWDAARYDTCVADTNTRAQLHVGTGF